MKWLVKESRWFNSIRALSLKLKCRTSPATNNPKRPFWCPMQVFPTTNFVGFFVYIIIMNILFLSQYPALLTGILGAILVSGSSSRKRYYGFAIWILSDIFWGLFGISSGGWGLVIMQLFFIVTSTRGMLNNRSKPQEPPSWHRPAWEPYDTVNRRPLDKLIRLYNTNMSHDTLPEGFTLRTKDGKCRVTKDSNWSRDRPWKFYYNGTAGNIYSGPLECQRVEGGNWETIAEHDARIQAIRDQNPSDGHRYGPMANDPLDHTPAT